MKIILTILFFFSALSAQAWNNHGHGTIAYIAEQNLTPTTREKCHNYINHTLHYYASWLDHWRFTEPYKHTTRWHAVIYDENNKMTDQMAMAVVMVDKIWDKMRDGGYKSLSDSLVADNIKYLIHMVGDMHCPVHIFYESSDGNKNHPYNQGYSVYWGKKRTKMSFHTFWDRGSQYLRPKWDYKRYRDHLDVYSKKQKASVVSGNAHTWGLEGAVLMREPIDLMPAGSYFNQLPTETVERMREICDRQLLVAGYRLAHILNTIFDDGYTLTSKKKK